MKLNFKSVIDRFADTAAILISIVSNSYYGMLWGQIHIHLPSEHLIMSFQTIEIKMAALSAKRFMENNKYFFAEASGGEIKKLVDNSAKRNTKKIHKIYRNDLRAFALRNYSEIIQNFTIAFEASLLGPVHFSDNLSALGNILRYTSRRKGFIY